jgi:hypothetical protein
MSLPNANQLSYNAWVQQLSTMIPVTVEETAGVYAFTDANLQNIIPSILNYAELRIQRDLDLLASTINNTYALTAGQNIFSIPIDDFFTVQNMEVVQLSGSTVISTAPLTPVSREFIQNCYGGMAKAGMPRYFAMIGSSFGDNYDTNNTILLGPTPAYGFSVRIFGTNVTPSLYSYAAAGVADTEYTYISSYYPDMLMCACMIYVAGYQKNYSAASDDAGAPMNWEKQYQTLRIGAVQTESERRFQGSAWTAYPTSTSATPTR